METMKYNASLHYYYECMLSLLCERILSKKKTVALALQWSSRKDSNVSFKKWSADSTNVSNFLRQLLYCEWKQNITWENSFKYNWASYRIDFTYFQRECTKCQKQGKRKILLSAQAVLHFSSDIMSSLLIENYFEALWKRDVNESSEKNSVITQQNNHKMQSQQHKKEKTRKEKITCNKWIFLVKETGLKHRVNRETKTIKNEEREEIYGYWRPSPHGLWIAECARDWTSRKEKCWLLLTSMPRRIRMVIGVLLD